MLYRSAPWGKNNSCSVCTVAACTDKVVYAGLVGWFRVWWILAKIFLYYIISCFFPYVTFLLRGCSRGRIRLEGSKVYRCPHSSTGTEGKIAMLLATFAQGGFCVMLPANYVPLNESRLGQKQIICKSRLSVSWRY